MSVAKPPTNRRTLVVPTQYGFSDEAKDQLKQDALDLGWVSPDTRKNVNGLSAYLNSISRCKFYDNRPPDVRELDELLTAQNKLPIWTLEYTKRRHLLRLTKQTKLRFYALAIEYMIGNPRKYNYLDSAVGVIGPLIEALGIHWLRPIDPPQAPQLAVVHSKEDRRVQSEATRMFYKSFD